jgi:hypothetical protein
MFVNIIERLFGLTKVWINGVQINEGLLYWIKDLTAAGLRSSVP